MKRVGGGAPRLGRRWIVPATTAVGMGLAALAPLLVWTAVVQR